MEFRFAKENLTLSQALTLEWLETNGLGGYASSSLINCHTSKYHGLLVNKLPSLPDKYVLLSKIEDIFCYDNLEYKLTAHQYPGVLQNGSFDDFQEFVLNTHPCFYYKFQDIVFSKEILMPYLENTVLIKYKIIKSDAKNQALQLKIRPLVAARNFHILAKENPYFDNQKTSIQNGLKISTYSKLPDLFFQADKDLQFTDFPVWYRNFLYEKDKDRGYDFREDLFSSGIFALDFDKKGEIIFSCSTKEQEINNLGEKWQNEIDRRKKLFTGFKGSEFQKQLKKASCDFIEENPNSGGFAVVAGYHWFLEWGRDAMISLPGLMLYSGLEDKFLEVLKEFAKNEKDGVIPNFLGESLEKNAYNSVDAGLWFAWAIQQYCFKTKDVKSIAKYLWPTLKNIFINYKSGTMYNIKMDEKNCLLYAGSKDVNLTWMDAVINGVPVTPRYGFAVEINALWYNMLCFMRTLAVLFSDSIKYELDHVIAAIKENFINVFWNKETNCLFDFVNDEQKCAAIRPNQIFAVSLKYSPLAKKYAVKVVKAVKDNLLTPFGLRTLAPDDPSYIGVFAGNNQDLDKAYHNGTIWPWLLGHFGEALLKISESTKEAVEVLKPCLEKINAHFFEAGIGTISEVFSGDFPYKPGGCIAQAWSVAEILRLTYLLNMKSNVKL